MSMKTSLARRSIWHLFVPLFQLVVLGRSWLYGASGCQRVKKGLGAEFREMGKEVGCSNQVWKYWLNHAGWCHLVFVWDAQLPTWDAGWKCQQVIRMLWVKAMERSLMYCGNTCEWAKQHNVVQCSEHYERNHAAVMWHVWTNNFPRIWQNCWDFWLICPKCMADRLEWSEYFA